MNGANVLASKTRNAELNSREDPEIHTQLIPKFIHVNRFSERSPETIVISLKLSIHTQTDAL